MNRCWICGENDCPVRVVETVLLAFVFILAIIGIGALVVLSDEADAFPEMTRLGYASCSSCHVSPAGGGMLTAYGRGMAGEMSTWSAEDEGDVGHGLLPEIPDQYALLGGDVRTMSLRGDGGLRDDFLMQADAEAALQLVPGLWLVGGTGSYGKAEKQEFRRYYALVNFPGDHVSLRVGRFFPAYGIMFPDHTLASRQALGWGEGQESYNAELSYRTKAGEIFLTQVYGASGGMDITASQGGIWATKSETQMIARAAYYLGETSQIGIDGMRGSGYEKDRTVYGLYAMTSPVHGLYSLTQYDRQTYDHEKPQDIATELVGYEFVRGAHVRAKAEYVSQQPVEYGAELQWFPRPHFEFLGGWLRQADRNFWSFMTHYYL